MIATDAERADAADRLMDVLDEIRLLIRKADDILRELAPLGSINVFPKFVRGYNIIHYFNIIREPLDQARNLVAVQGYECRRNVEKKNSTLLGQMPKICYNINDEH